MLVVVLDLWAVPSSYSLNGEISGLGIAGTAGVRSVRGCAPGERGSSKRWDLSGGKVLTTMVGYTDAAPLPGLATFFGGLV